jgi:arsenate reductase
MAEGYLSARYADDYEGYSAGTEPSHVNPNAIKVMAEVGIDISLHRSKSVEEFHGTTFDYVVTVCDHAKETCPFFPGKNILHKSFRDPSAFKGTEESILQDFRQVRDKIAEWIENTFKRSTH